jgi:hypothetical protein
VTCGRVGWECACPPIEWCEKCEMYRQVVDGGSAAGFTGAPILWSDLDCGHQVVDASADVLEVQE